MFWNDDDDEDVGDDDVGDDGDGDDGGDDVDDFNSIFCSS